MQRHYGINFKVLKLLVCSQFDLGSKFANDEFIRITTGAQSRFMC